MNEDLEEQGYFAQGHTLVQESTACQGRVSIIEEFVFSARDAHRSTRFIKGLKEFNQFVLFEDLPQDMIDDAEKKLIRLGGRSDISGYNIRR